MALCIPDYGWVPNLSGPPNWFSGADVNTSLTDPRWVSALRLSVDAGSGEKFTIRAVRNSAANQLFLSVWVQYDPSTVFQDTDKLWIGFNPAAGAGGTPTVVTFNYSNEFPEEASAADLTPGAFTWNGASWSSGILPAWVTNARVWKKNTSGGATSWAYQMVINTATAGLGATFGMCVQARCEAFPVLPTYRYPVGMPLINTTVGASGLNPGTGAHWQAVSFGAGCDPGVWIDPGRIGTTNADTHKINLYSPNTFQARPRNDSGASANIQARFRLANWGSAASGAWRDLLVTPPGAVLGSSDGTLQGSWQPNSAVDVNLPGGGTQNEVAFYTSHWHQCMMVVLEAVSGTVYFSRDSCVRNMDFDKVSKLIRPAEISVRGVEDAFPLPERDVYISVERINVPDTIDGDTWAKYQKVQELYQSLSSNIDGFSDEQRYVALIGGDLRHLRYIRADVFAEWVRDAYSKEHLIVGEGFFEALRRLGVVADSLPELVDRYAEQARYYLEQLAYDEAGQPILDEGLREGVRILLEHISYRGDVTLPAPQLPPAEELEQFMPTVRYHVFRDTGLRTDMGGVVYPLVEPQASFGFYLWLDHEVERWELRLRNAEKIAENLYLIRVPTEGEAEVTTVIHAVERGEEDQVDPPEPIVKPPIYELTPDGRPTPQPTGCLEAIAQVFDGLGPIGKAVARLLRSLGTP